MENKYIDGLLALLNQPITVYFISIFIGILIFFFWLGVPLSDNLITIMVGYSVVTALSSSR